MKNGRWLMKDAAYWAEVRAAVGRGAPTILFGTSTRSLNRSLEKLMAISEQGVREMTFENFMQVIRDRVAQVQQDEGLTRVQAMLRVEEEVSAITGQMLD